MQSYNIFFAFSCYILSLLFFSTVCFRFLLLKAVCRLQHDSVLYATSHWGTSPVFRGFELGLKSVYLPFHSQANLLLPSNKHLLTNAQDRCMQKVFFMRLRYMWHIFNDKTQAFCKQLTTNMRVRDKRCSLCKLSRNASWLDCYSFLIPNSHNA